VSGLIENARKIMDTASDADDAGMGSADWTIFFGPEGGLEMIAGSDAPLDSLTWSRGARMAWQVRHLDGGVRVEGLAAGQRCRMETGSGRQCSQMHPAQLLNTGGMYQLVQAV
jgi:hypothetical protein